MAIYTDCDSELVGELFRVEVVCRSVRYLPYSIEDDSDDYYGDYQFLWAKVFFF